MAKYIFFRYIWSSSTVPKSAQNHKSEMGALLIMKVTSGPHPRAGSSCQEDQPCDWNCWNFQSQPFHLEPLGRERGLEVELVNDLAVITMWWSFHKNPNGQLLFLFFFPDSFYTCKTRNFLHATDPGLKFHENRISLVKDLNQSISSPGCWFVFFITSFNKLVNVFSLSYVSHSSKLIKPKEDVFGTSSL